MKQVKIKSMSLANFKGIKSFNIELNGATKIYGDNATGKTTLVDAFTWLLFGKDSTDRKDFSIKTFDSQNNVIHKLDHEVSAVFDINGEEMNLRRVMREKWVTKRGTETPELSGHETLFFWNDVPMQAGEYQAKVDQVISEQTFKMITSPLYFNSLKWQDRRNILTSIAGDISDAEIAQSNKEFKALIDSLGNKSLEEFKKELAAKRKKLKDELLLIPARIDEVTRNTPQSKNWKQIQDEIDIINHQIGTIDAQLADSSKQSGSFYAEKQARLKRINDLKTIVSEFEFKGRQLFSNQMHEKQTVIEAAQGRIEKLKRHRDESASEIETLKASISIFKSEQSKLRDQWMKVNAEQFSGFDSESDNFVCPTCKQMLPDEEIESKKAQLVANFNANKDKRLKAISEEGKAINPRIAKLEEQIKAIQEADFDGLIKKEEAIIQQWNDKKLESVQSILSGNKEYEAAVTELNKLESEPEEGFTQADNSELKSKKADLLTKVDLLKKDLTLKSQIEQADARKTELLNQEKKYATQLAALEKTEFTIQEFTRAKVDVLESKINGMFQGVKFRLFDTQLNGGLIECCDTLIDGVPWNDANNAAKINAGIAIINVLTSHYGQTAPIWIDNSESITNIHSTESQRIELYVSESDKVLRVA